MSRADISGLDKYKLLRYNRCIMNLINSQFLIDLYLYGNYSLDEIREIGLRYASQEDLDYALEVINAYENFVSQHKEWQQKFDAKNEIEVLNEFFPELKNNPQELLEALYENLKEFKKRKEILNEIIFEKRGILSKYPAALDDVFEELAFVTSRINNIQILIDYLHNSNVHLEYSEEKVERQKFKEKVHKVLELDIDRVVENEFGTRIPRGEPAMIRCQLPGHNDREPSFAVYRRTNSFYCFGCNNGGNVITFIEIFKKFDFYDAVNYLYEKYV